MHLCTCLFIVTAAGIQNPTGESQTADGLQMNFLQSKLTNYTRINKSKGTANVRAVKKRSSFNAILIPTIHGCCTNFNYLHLSYIIQYCVRIYKFEGQVPCSRAAPQIELASCHSLLNPCTSFEDV